MEMSVDAVRKLGFCGTPLPIGLTHVVAGDPLPDGKTSGGPSADGVTVSADLDLGGCGSLVLLPDGLTVGGDLKLVDCKSLIRLPEGLTVGEGLDLSGCTSLRSLPERLSVGGWTNLNDCKLLASLPFGFACGGFLGLRGCTALSALPEYLSVNQLDIRGCTALKSLPDTLVVRYKLELDGCDIDQNSVFVDGVIPASIAAALVGRRLGDALEHRLISNPAFYDAVIEHVGFCDDGLTCFHLDRHMPSLIVASPSYQSVIEDQADNTPLGQDDDSWRDLTDEDIVAIRHA